MRHEKTTKTDSCKMNFLTLCVYIFIYTYARTREECALHVKKKSKTPPPWRGVISFSAVCV